MSSMTYDELCEGLPENIRNNQEMLLGICKQAKVDVPMESRFYQKNHTPKANKNNPEPTEVEYIVVPSPQGGRDFWVRKEDFADLITGAIVFGEAEGLLDVEE